MTDPASPVSFAGRHIGPSDADVDKMLAALGYASLDELAAAAVPDAIKATEGLDLAPATETEVLAALRALADRNRVMASMIGLGYYDTITPPVLRRNILESPAWYTAYTPYQPEISQGRLEALLNFQTMVADLTGLDIASASLLDEATAAAEALALCRRVSKVSDDAAFVIDRDCHPQTIAVVETRAEPLGLPVVVTDVAADGLPDGEIFGVLLQYPASSGRLVDWSGVISAAHERGALASVATDLLALCLLRAPGAMGADVAVGSAQRFGVPMGSGARTPVSWPSATDCSDRYPAAWSGCRSTLMAIGRTGSHCRHASSTSAERRRRRTSAPRRCCSR